jgi:hypothetical protein
MRLSDGDQQCLSWAVKHALSLGDPDVRLVVPYLLFDAILDSSTRSNHRALNGGIAPLSWTGWNRFAPPLGLGCRCTLIGITRARAGKLLANGASYFDLLQAIPPGAGPDAEWRRRDGWWEAILELAEKGPP